MAHVTAPPGVDNSWKRNGESWDGKTASSTEECLSGMVNRGTEIEETLFGWNLNLGGIKRKNLVKESSFTIIEQDIFLFNRI